MYKSDSDSTEKPKKSRTELVTWIAEIRTDRRQVFTESTALAREY